MKTEITAVAQIENFNLGDFTTYTKGVLVTCDAEAAMRRVWRAAIGALPWTGETVDTIIKGRNSHLFWGNEQPSGLVCDDWIVAVDADKGGVIVTRNVDFCDDEPLDLGKEWIDVLDRLRNFFAIEQVDEEPDYEHLFS
ncbi:hypothetical protein HGG70_05200 [Rhodobacteraceae bacterium R_SAG4]|nr:hypothetical protein [Rhodobacteraceae bacterium R_SAG4]